MKKEDFFSKIKIKYADDEEKARTKEDIKTFDIKDGEQITEFFCRSDVFLLADVIGKFVKVSIEEYGLNPLYCVSLPGYRYLCSLKNNDIKLQTLQDDDMILTLENNIRGGLSGVMGDHYENRMNKKLYGCYELIWTFNVSNVTL